MSYDIDFKIYYRLKFQQWNLRIKNFLQKSSNFLTIVVDFTFESVLTHYTIQS